MYDQHRQDKLEKQALSVEFGVGCMNMETWVR